jgi:hypothetical protein
LDGELRYQVRERGSIFQLLLPDSSRPQQSVASGPSVASDSAVVL